MLAAGCLLTLGQFLQFIAGIFGLSPRSSDVVKDNPCVQYVHLSDRC